MLFHPTYKEKLLNISYLYLYLFWRYSHIKLLFTSLKFSFYAILELLVGYFQNHCEFLDNIFRKCYHIKAFVFRKFQFCRMPFRKFHFCRMPFEIVFFNNSISCFYNCSSYFSALIFTSVTEESEKL